eukprot:2326205-Rhodomonas_salina.1
MALVADGGCGSRCTRWRSCWTCGRRTRACRSSCASSRSLPRLSRTQLCQGSFVVAAAAAAAVVVVVVVVGVGVGGVRCSTSLSCQDECAQRKARSWRGVCAVGCSG